jgi:hypothetical protein
MLLCLGVLARHAVQDVLRLVVQQPGGELLGITEDECVGQDLPLAVELGQSGHEVAAKKQDRGHRREGVRGHLQEGQCQRDAVRRGGAPQFADGERRGQGSAQQAETDHDHDISS